MRIVANARPACLVALEGEEVQLYDLAAADGTAVRARHSVQGAHYLAACDDYVGVLVGRLAPARASVEDAKMERLRWDDLTPLGATPLGHVERRGIALSRDGGRVAFPDWSTCQVVVADVATGKHIAAAGQRSAIPSGVSWSPDGARLVAGVTWQGGGALRIFDVAAIANDTLPMHDLAEDPPAPRDLPALAASPGLDDAAYFSVFSSSGELVAFSNESWGGRGLFVYDVATRKLAWSKIIPSTSEESDDWHPFAVAFGDTLLLVGGPTSITAYRARDGRELGAIETAGDGRGGFAVDDARERVWVPSAPPIAYAFLPSWRG